MENTKEILHLRLKNEKVELHKWLLLINLIIAGISGLNSTSDNLIILFKWLFTITFLLFLIPTEKVKTLFYHANRYIVATCIGIASVIIIYSISSDSEHLKINITLYCILLLFNTLFFRGNTFIFILTSIPTLITALLMHSTQDLSLVFSKENLLILIIINLMMMIIHYLHLKYYIHHNEHLKLEKLHEKETEKLTKDKNFLVKILCHDLGNSLTIIEVSSSILQRLLINQNCYSKPIQESIERCQRAVKEQFDIINSVKKKINLESNNDISLEPINVEKIIENIRFTFKDKLKQKQLELLLDLNHQNHDLLAEPVSLVNNVLNNIVSNAIKFSNPGGTLKLKTFIKEDMFYLQIIDCGVGMEEEYIKDIFSDFVKTSRTGTEGEKGTGYGLPLANAFMKSYNGKIDVESKVGKGTVFTLSFKVAN